MKPIRKETLVALARELPCHDWTEEELQELVAPRFGIITGFQDLLDDLERIRQIDLGNLPPAQRVSTPRDPDS